MASQRKSINRKSITSNKSMEGSPQESPPNVKITPGVVKDKILYGGTLGIVTNENVNVPDKKQHVFLTENIMDLCSFAKGDRVTVEFDNTSTLPPVARTVWPGSGKTGTSVLFTKTGLFTSGAEINSKVTVRKLPSSHIRDASDVVVIALNKPEFVPITAELINYVSQRHTDDVFCKGNILCVFHGGKNLKFEIKSIEGVPTDSVQSLEHSFQSLNVDDIPTTENHVLFRMTGRTRWRIFENSEQFLEETQDAAAEESLSNIGGLDEEIARITKKIRTCLLSASLDRTPRAIHTKSLLLHGVPGTGKTTLANAIAKEFRSHNVNSVNINPRCLRKDANLNPEDALRHLFEEAVRKSPCLVILDEIDKYCPASSSRATDSQKRLSDTLLTIFDDVNRKVSCRRVFILAIASKPDSIDPEFRRPGRLDREIEIPTPSPSARFDILTKFLEVFKISLTRDDLNEIALNTHGFVGADLWSLCSEAASLADERNAEKVEVSDFKQALTSVRPSAMREVQIEVANVKWSDIGGQENLKLTLRQAVEWPLRYPERFTRLGMEAPKGVLMFGPPGCSKTMIAKALATESGLNFISVKGPELFSKWVGESERAVREVFRKAKQVAPSIIFFDEIDGLGGERSDGSATTGSSVHERVVTQLLTEMDGISPLGQVTVVAATNRPHGIDKALLRPGRLDSIVYVPLPDADTRREIFKIRLAKMPVPDVNVDELVQLTEDYSGAELISVCNKAGLKALEENPDAQIVTMEHFKKALETVKPRTSKIRIQMYNEFLASR